MFNEIVGQKTCIEHLKKAIKSGHVSHAYIIYGEKNSGKKMLAKAFATTLLCESSVEDACGKCNSCKRAISNNHPDIIYITPEDKKTISTKAIRENVADTVSIRPFDSKYKVYIIDGADKMHKNAQNALLKTLEEPPEYAVLILLAQSSEAMLSTVKSRCVQLFLTPIEKTDQIDYLVNHYNVSKEEADRVVRFSGGNLGKSINLIQETGFTQTYYNVEKIVYGLRETDELTVPEAVKVGLEYKDSLHNFFELLELWFRDVLLCKSMDETEEIVFYSSQKKLKQLASSISYKGLNEIIKVIEDSIIRLDSNVNDELLLEIVMITIKESK